MTKNNKPQHMFELRVYSEDTDCYDMVYHPSYLSFLSRARVEWLRGLGFGLKELHDNGYLFAVRRVTIDYLQPAKLDDELQVTTYIKEIKRVSLLIEQIVIRPRDELTICKAEVKLAFLDKSLHLAKMPESIIKDML